MHLQDLPGAILRHILNGENSWCAIELWKCGNRTLNARLANKGVTNVLLCARHRISTSRWPRCLSFFKLEHLSIVHPFEALGTPAMIHSELKKLPDTLLTLKIEATHLIEAIFPTPNSTHQILSSNDFNTTAPLPSPPTSMESADQNRLETMLWNLNTTWPRLERFELRDRSGFQLAPFAFPLLPRSLISFRCDSYIQDSINDFSQLPAGLQTLDLLSESIGPEAMLTLPKSLIHIYDILNPDAVALWTASPSILPLLERFTWEKNPFPRSSPITGTTSSIAGTSSSIADKSSPMFSESLTGMDFLDEVTELPPLSQLPSRLKFLHIEIQGCVFRHEQIAALPRSLESLFVAHMEWNGMKPNDFPPQLRVLESDLFGFNHRCFSLLPRTLTVLKSQAEIVSSVISASELEELKVIGRQCLTLDQERWSFAKSKLCKSGARREAYIARVEDGQLFGLPLGLTTLSFTPADGCQHFLLPPLVEHYKIDTVALTDRETLSLVPPSEAFCAEIYKLTTAFPPQSDTVSVIPTESSLYQSEITRLKLRTISPGLQSQNVLLQCLPPTLTFLFIESRLPISIDVQHLPTSLTWLKLVRCRFDTSNWPGLLLRKLTTLHLPPDVPIQGAWLPQLPQNLTNLSATFIDITLSDLRTLPPTMNNVSCYGNNRLPAAKLVAVLRDLCRPFWRIRQFSDAYLTSEIEKAMDPDEKSLLETVNDVDPRVSARFNL